MAITKIHPIKSTLNLAIAYITNSNKTEEKVLVHGGSCFAETAAIQFARTKEAHQTKTPILAQHLIQSFLPGETTPEQGA